MDGALTGEVRRDRNAPFGLLQLLDDGSFVIPGANKPANANQRIRLFRFNEVGVASGLAGSRLQIKIRAQVEPVVVE